MASSVDCLSAKITLHSILNNLPEQPSTNETKESFEAQQGRTRNLSLKHEISITQQLAFVCAYSSNPLHVAAVCIEEVAARSSLVFRLAANAGAHDCLIKGMSNVANILQDEARNSKITYIYRLH